MNKLYGLIGKKLSHSYSVEIHKAIMAELNIEADYKLFELAEDELKDFIVNPIENLHGASVTIPYKIDVIDFLDETSTEAKNIGAVNTIKFENGKTTGYNTDYFGFSMMLNHFNINVKNKDVVVLGTGGASKAVIQYLKDSSCKSITLVTRTIDHSIDYNMSIVNYDELEFINKDIVINTTPNGMYPNIDSSPVTINQIKGIEAAVDAIYNPETTKFMTLATELGAVSISGLYMLVAQAIKAQEIWQNITIDDSVTLKVFNDLSAKFK